MAKSSEPPKPLGELIDQIEQIREELLSIQRTLEKMEPRTPDALRNEAVEKLGVLD